MTAVAQDAGVTLRDVHAVIANDETRAVVKVHVERDGMARQQLNVKYRGNGDPPELPA
jgi:hypothetical protein